LVAEDEAGLKKEQREATADKAVARAETPFWMRQVFGDLPVEYRMGAGLLFTNPRVKKVAFPGCRAI